MKIEEITHDAYTRGDSDCPYGQHDWREPIDSICDRDVYCVACGMHGEIDDGRVFYPAT